MPNEQMGELPLPSLVPRGTRRKEVRGQRHRGEPRRRTYAEQSALLVRGGWYAPEVRRAALNPWQHPGTRARKTAEWLRSWLGRQERWRWWRPLEPEVPHDERCRLSASTVEPWLDGAGRTAEPTVAGPLQGIASAEQVGTAGLWARLRGGAKRVVLALSARVSFHGLVWPPVVVVEEEARAGSWGQRLVRAQQAGLDLAEERGVTSDRATGLASYVAQQLPWGNHPRCDFPFWRSRRENWAGRWRQP